MQPDASHDIQTAGAAAAAPRMQLDICHQPIPLVLPRGGLRTKSPHDVFHLPTQPNVDSRPR